MKYLALMSGELNGTVSCVGGGGGGLRGAPGSHSELIKLQLRVHATVLQSTLRGTEDKAFCRSPRSPTTCAGNILTTSHVDRSRRRTQQQIRRLSDEILG